MAFHPSRSSDWSFNSALSLCRCWWHSKISSATSRRSLLKPSVFPPKKRLTVCVSSRWLSDGLWLLRYRQGGFSRNLARHEIIDQVLTVQEDCGVSATLSLWAWEPLLNTTNVVAAIKSLNEDVGISKVNDFIHSWHPRSHPPASSIQQVTLAVSLHASNQTLREKLIPSAHYPSKDLGRMPRICAVDESPHHFWVCSRRSQWLARTRNPHSTATGFQSHVNLIPYNPIREADYQRPNLSVSRLSTSWSSNRRWVSVTRGLEADAACGQPGNET